MIDYFTKDDDVSIKFPGLSFPITLSCLDRMLSYYIDKALNKEGVH